MIGIVIYHLHLLRFGVQTDVPESADWYNSSYIMAWGSNVPQ
ncbi:Respiratory nitrate reductase alpha chain (EC, partial [uncultured Gammaproteobacteria bacterium]